MWLSNRPPVAVPLAEMMTEGRVRAAAMRVASFCDSAALVTIRTPSHSPSASDAGMRSSFLCLTVSSVA